MILQLIALAQNGETGLPTNQPVNYYFLVAITALAGAIVFMYKRERDSNAKALEREREIQNEMLKRETMHGDALREVLEKAIVSFSEVEKVVVRVTGENKDAVMAEIDKSKKEIISEIKSKL